MPDKLVFVKELKSGTTKGENPKQYPIVVDQDNEQWFIWTNTKFELGKAYLITFHINDKQFKDIDKITPVVNIFHQKALAETANRNDFLRNYFMSLSYSKDMVVGGMLEPDKMFDKAHEIYQWVNEKADSEMSKINPIEEKK